MSKTLSWGASDAARPFSATLLYLAASALQAASKLLERLAVRVTDAQAAPDLALQHVEFHAFHRDGAAPEGAIYVNGELVGVLQGVSRL